MLAQEVIARKRDGHALSEAEIQHFVDGLVSGAWGDSQAAALAMAIVCRGMQPTETALLTQAMTRSGAVLDWSQAGLAGPVLDKHSTGGVGDKVSLILAPLLAACGGIVPMISGRGLGHTGGTLDKLQALPGYDINPQHDRLLAVLKNSGCAIVGASQQLAPADRRLYAIRDVTATVESLPLITASILSKKLAAGLQSLVMDVKVGNGAFTSSMAQATALAQSLVNVAAGAGLPTVALLTDMDQPLGLTVGNALEVQEAINCLTGREQEPRLREVTLALCGHALHLAGLARSADEGAQRAEQALVSGAAAERWAAMVAGLGGPADVLRDAGLGVAPLAVDVPAPADGWIQTIDTRALGLAVVELGGGRRLPSDPIDPRVGLSGLLPLGTRVSAGQALARIHAATSASAEQAVLRVKRAIRVTASASSVAQAVVHGVVGRPNA